MNGILGLWRLPAGVVAILAVLGVFDHSGVGPTYSLNAYAVSALIAAAAAVIVAALWSDRRRSAGPAALVAVAVSLTASTTAAVTGGPTSAAAGSWLYTETVSLLGLILVCAWAAPARWGVLSCLAGTVAVAVLVTRFRVLADTADGIMSASLLWAMGGVAAAGLGLWLRNLEWRRLSAVREVRRTERLELSRDLHDFVAHHVSGMVVQAQAAQLVCSRNPSEAVHALKEIEEAGVQALACMRRTVSVLRDHETSEVARDAAFGVPDLPALVSGFPQASLAVAENLAVSSAVGNTAYRIVLEALTNVRRHAPTATSVEVRIEKADNATVRVVVADNATHAGTRSVGGGFGLTGLEERVIAIGGTFTSGPRQPAGWVVEATLPRKETG